MTFAGSSILVIGGTRFMGYSLIWQLLFAGHATTMTLLGGGALVAHDAVPVADMAWVFPGQGSQAVGMGRDLYERYDAAREVFKKHQDAVVWVSAVMKMRGGGPLAVPASRRRAPAPGLRREGAPPWAEAHGPRARGGERG